MSVQIKKLCYGGMFIALTALGTMVITIPVPATNGYIHIGDSVILLISFYFGYKYGMIAGGIGSALADILAGYSHWALFTLIIKGIMGLIIGKMCNNQKPIISFKNMATIVSAEIFMVFGYFLGGRVLKGSFLVSLESVPANIIQGAGGIIIFCILGVAFKKSGIINYIHAK